MSKIFALTEASSIALHGMVLIAKSEERLNVIKVSELIHSSKHHVAKVFQRLVKENYLKSTRGPSGGFVLAKVPKKITLLNIYEAIEGKLEIHACPIGHNKCPFQNCMFGTISTDMTENFKNYLKSKTLFDFI